MKKYGNRIPHEYFVVTGKGESSVGSKGLPYETGSYDEALNDAGIQNANIIFYTSVIPPTSKEITREEGIQRMNWGEVMECIMAETNGEKGEKISAAVITTSVTDPNGNYLGGFACEYSGEESREKAEKSLLYSIEGMIERRGYGKFANGLKMKTDCKTDRGYIIHPGKVFLFEEMIVKEKHGTVFASICFVSYLYPQNLEIKKNQNTQKNQKTKKNKKYI